MKLEDYLPDLEEETGPIKNVKEWAPGVYYIETGQEEVFAKEFFAVLDGAPMAAKVRNYGSCNMRSANIVLTTRESPCRRRSSMISASMP